MATNLDALAIRRALGQGDWLPPRPMGPDGWSYLHRRSDSSVIVTCALFDGVEWLHASISHPDVMPSYDDLKLLHAAVFGAGWAYQVFAPPADHVNIHQRALHLFGRLDGAAALPDFTMGTGSI
jgi:hypothetical protein